MSATDLDPEWGKDDASEPPGFRDQWVNAAGQACGMYGPAAAPAPSPAPQGAAGMTEERFATTLTDEQITDGCRDLSNPARFDLWMALATAAYARQLADDPRLSDADSSWLMATRDAIYWLAEKWLTSLRASTGGADAALREQRDEALAALGIRPDEEGGWAFQNGWCRDLSEAIERAKWAVASEAARAVRAALHPSTPENLTNG